MWCGNGINSENDLEMDEKFMIGSESKLKRLFHKPQRERSQHLLAYCNRYRQSILDRGNKLLDVIRTTLNIWPRSNALEKQSNKHVMFADSLGLDLELIHTIQINSQAGDELDKLITKQSFFRSYNRRFNHDNNNINCTSTALTFAKLNRTQRPHLQSDVLIVPKFAISPDRNYEKLITSGICLNSVEIFDQSSIRGVILTLTKPSEANYGGFDSRSLLESLYLCLF
jgi:hypothetical protein